MPRVCVPRGWVWIFVDQMLLSCSSSGASVVAIDNKIEQAMVSSRLRPRFGTAQEASSKVT